MALGDPIPMPANGWPAPTMGERAAAAARQNMYRRALFGGPAALGPGGPQVPATRNVSAAIRNAIVQAPLGLGSGQQPPIRVANLNNVGLGSGGPAPVAAQAAAASNGLPAIPAVASPSNLPGAVGAGGAATGAPGVGVGQAARAAAGVAPAAPGAVASTSAARQAALAGLASSGGLGGAGAAGAAGAAAPAAAAPWLSRMMTSTAPAGSGRLASMLATPAWRAGGYGLLGYGGGQVVQAVTGSQDGTWDDAARNAAVGAGIGAGIGSVVPGVGTGIGAVVGGGLGALGSIFGPWKGQDSPDTEKGREVEAQLDSLNTTFDRFDVSPETRQQVLAQFQIGVEDLGKASEVKTFAAQVRSALPTAIAQDQITQQRDQAIEQEQRRRSANAAAMQAWIGPMMQQSFDTMQSFAGDLSTAISANAEHYTTPALQAAAKAQAARIPMDAAMQQAYALQQLAMTPSLYGYETQRNDQGAYATDLTSILNATPQTVTDPVTGMPMDPTTGQVVAPAAGG